MRLIEVTPATNAALIKIPENVVSVFRGFRDAADGGNAGFDEVVLKRQRARVVRAKRIRFE